MQGLYWLKDSDILDGGLCLFQGSWILKIGSDIGFDMPPQMIRSRPRSDADLTDQLILETLGQDPRGFGYATNAWTVALVSAYLQQQQGIEVKPATLRRRFHRMGLRYKRPRYVYEDKEPNRVQKKGRSSASSTHGRKERFC